MTDITEETRALIDRVKDRPSITRMSHVAQIEVIEQLRAALVAALSEDDTDWEYSIAYPANGEWDTDGVGAFATVDEAREDFNGGEYLASDRVVRRRKAGPWEPVPENTGSGS